MELFKLGRRQETAAQQETHSTIESVRPVGPAILFISNQPLHVQKDSGLFPEEKLIKNILPKEVHLTSVNAPQGGEFPSLGNFDGIIVGGSKHNTHERLKWMKEEQELLEKAGELGLAVLGICFGHQLISKTYEGIVIHNEKGLEFGITDVILTEAGKRDPLYEGLPEKLWVAQGHGDIVTNRPPGSIVLASNKMSDYQSLALGGHIRTVQFHPELSAPQLIKVAEARKKALKKSGFLNEKHTLKNFRKKTEHKANEQFEENRRKIGANFIAHFAYPRQ